MAIANNIVFDRFLTDFFLFKYLLATYYFIFYLKKKKRDKNILIAKIQNWKYDLLLKTDFTLMEK